MITSCLKKQNRGGWIWVYFKFLRKKIAPSSNSSPFPADIPARRLSKHPFVFADKLRRTFIADGIGGVGDIILIGQHKALRFIQAQRLLKLKRAECGHLFEVAEEAGRTHADFPGQFFHLERSLVIFPQLGNRLCHLIAGRTEGTDGS